MVSGLQTSSGMQSDHFHDQLLSIIDRNLELEYFDVAALASEFGLSRSQLYRRLKHSTGTSPSELLMARRLERGRDRIVAGDSPIGEIALSVGFKSLAHFTQRFRLRYGFPPAQFRARVRKKSTVQPRR